MWRSRCCAKRRPVARRPPNAKCRRRSAKASPCARTTSRRSRTTATRESASRSTSVPTWSRQHRGLRAGSAQGRRGQGAHDRALHGRRRVFAGLPTLRCWLAPGAISISITRGSCRSNRPSSSARECEASALAVDRRLTNSEGATVSLHEAQFVYSNSNGFAGGYSSSRHAIYCSVIGEEDGSMQREDWYTSARSPADLEPARDVGRRAGVRTVRRLGARKLATMECPVVYEAPVATRPRGSLRQRGQRRQSLPQVVVSARQSRASRYSARGSRFVRSPMCPEGRHRRLSTTKALRRSRETWSSTVWFRDIFWAAIRPASSASSRQRMRAATTISIVSHGDDELDGCSGKWAAGCW